MADVDLIIPAYNAEATIGNVLASVASLTALERIRVILVDDASTDATLDAVRAAMIKHPQLAGRCVVKSLPVNLGSAGAYNEALQMADARWIARCDDDDALMPDAIARMLELADKSGADIICGSMLCDKGPTQQIMRPSLLKGLDNTPLTTVNFSLCNKLIRRSLLFRAPDAGPLSVLPGINCWDDLSLTARLMALPGCKIAELAGAPVYLYNRRDGAESLSRSSREYILEQHIECAVRLAEWFDANELSAGCKLFMLRLKFISKVKLLRGEGALGRLARWRATFPETASAIMSMKVDMSLPLRVIFRLLAM